MKKVIKWIYILFICLISIKSYSKEFKFEQRKISQNEILNKYFYHYTIYEIPLKEISNFVSNSSMPVILDFNLVNQSYSLQLQLNDLRSKDFKAIAMTALGEKEIPQGLATTYKNSDESNFENQTRLTIDDGTCEGFIFTKNKKVYFDKLNRFAANFPDNYIVVYEENDVIPDANSRCLTQEIAHQGETNHLGNSTEMNTGSCKFVDIATEADYEYYQAFGSNALGALSRIQTILNAAEGVYTSTFKVKFVLKYQQIWTIIGDPYSGDSLQVILPQFKNWWAANRTSVIRDITHMFTGRTVLNNTVGFAYRPGICDNTWYYGCVTNQNPVSAGTINLTVHELGHNFGANHDTISACNAANVMCPFIFYGGNQTFSSQSINEINNYVATTSCMNETFPSNTFLLGGFGNYSFVKLLALSNIDLNSALGEAIILNGGFGYIEAGNQIVFTPTNPNTNGFTAFEGSTVVLRISDLSNSCLPLAKEAGSNYFQLEKVGISVYPNPANDFITIKINNAVSKTILKIYNSTMQLVKMMNFESGFENEISLSDFTNGIYFIDAQSGGQSYKTKFVVSR